MRDASLECAVGYGGHAQSAHLLLPGLRNIHATYFRSSISHVLLTNVQLKIEGEQTSAIVYASTTQIAVEQVRFAEQQRVFGFILNFYVVYDSKNAVPLTTKLKFKLAMRVSIDPITIASVTSMAGIKQAANTPDYVQGAKGYAQPVGAIGADGFTYILLGGAILPSLLHQDPRYFYQGTGTTSCASGTRSSARSSAGETMAAGNRTTRAWELIWHRAPSRTPIIQNRTAARDWWSGTLRLALPSAWPADLRKSLFCAGLRTAPQISTECSNGRSKLWVVYANDCDKISRTSRKV
jgi:hypothetical protein